MWYSRHTDVTVCNIPNTHCSVCLFFTQYPSLRLYNLFTVTSFRISWYWDRNTDESSQQEIKTLQWKDKKDDQKRRRQDNNKNATAVPAYLALMQKKKTNAVLIHYMLCSFIKCCAYIICAERELFHGNNFRDMSGDFCSLLKEQREKEAKALLRGGGGDLGTVSSSSFHISTSWFMTKFHKLPYLLSHPVSIHYSIVALYECKTCGRRDKYRYGNSFQLL